jgi:lactate dehydrogenase-like 2-hydroxyacid dehydrogenase
MTTDPTYLIVGASLAGAKAAQTLREQGFGGQLVLIGEERERPYERPPLSKDYLQGKAERETIYVHPARWYADHDVDLRLGTAVTGVDPAAHEVTLADDTREMIGAAQLDRMRPQALLVNTSRGGLVDERALAQALAAGRLGGAAFDTFEHKLSGASPLLTLDNFVASPHAGAATVEAARRTGVAAVRELLAGRPSGT